MSGTQALVRLPLLQRARRRRRGPAIPRASSPATAARRSACTTWNCGAKLERLKASHIVFRPGVNEDLAATAVWGTQQARLLPGAKYDGVFAIWYGKGPGRRPQRRRVQARQPPGRVEARRRAGRDGRRPSRQVLHRLAPERAGARREPHPGAVSRPPCRNCSSTACSAGRCRASPACGSASSAPTRRSKAPSTVDIDPARFQLRAAGGSRCRRPGSTPTRDRWCCAKRTRCWSRAIRIPAAHAFARANGIDRVVIDGDRRRLGIVATGKGYVDVQQALRALGIDDARAAALGLRALQDRHDLAGRAARACASSRAGTRNCCSSKRRRRSSRTRPRSILYQPARGAAAAADRQVRRERRPAAAARRAAAVRRALRSSSRDRLGTLGLLDDARCANASRCCSRAQARVPRATRPARRCARRISARAARTTPRRRSPKAASRSPASAATRWRAA